MMRIALCDKNSQDAKQYAELLLQFAARHGIKIELSYFDSGEELISFFEHKLCNVDIIYLEIPIGRRDGMMTARKLKEMGCLAQIIFLADVEDYVYQSFEFNPVQYLLKKRLNIEEFESGFMRAVQVVRRNNEDLFVCEFNGMKSAIPISDISCFESFRRIIAVHYNGKETRFYGSLNSLNAMLSSKNFIRVHRSYIVHLPHIMRFNSHELSLKNGMNIPIGAAYLHRMQEEFSNYTSKFYVYRSGTEKAPLFL